MSTENRGSEWMNLYDANKDRLADALFLAMEFEDWEAIEDLIHIQKDINSRDSDRDWTLLMWAVFYGYSSVVKLLVEAGADVNLRGNFEPEEEFALSIAAYAGHKAIYNYLAPLTSIELRKVAEKTWEGSNLA